MLVDARDVYSQHKFDVSRTHQKFLVTLKPNVELKRQRPSKVPLHLKEKLEKLLTQLKDADVIREMGEDDDMGSFFVNPIILMPKNDYMKLVIDARYQNNGLEAKIFKSETNTTLTMDSGEISPLLIRVSLEGQTSHMRTTIRTMEGHMINA